jgi:transcriptional regulator with XRE-family HTH domain
MNATEQAPNARLLTPAELGLCVRLFREMRQWSQEQLAEISGLNVRTIQRVEQGQAASLDTRRALARAFEFEDLDVLNKPYTIPTEAELKAQKEKFERDYVTLQVQPLTTGKQLAKLAEGHMMDMCEPGFELPREADEVFAMLVDYFRDYRDCSEVYSEAQKFEVYDEMQSHIDALRDLGVSLRCAERRMQVKWGLNASPDAKPMPVSVAYVIAFRLGQEPKQIMTPKAASMRL